MISVQLVSLALLLVPSVLSQILNPPTNVSTGFVRLEGPQALSISPQPLPAEQITWFYTPNGLVAVDGDIIYGTAEDFNRNVLNLTYNSASGLNAAEGNDTTPARRSLRPLAPRSNSVFPNSDGVWPNGNVKYRYIDDATEEELGVYVEGAIAAWKAAVPCISFTKLPNGFGQSDGTTTINANRPNGGYCLASLGYSPFGTFMSLDTGGACGVPEMIHEIGHLLGLYHEQKRPDSFKYDRFVCQNLIDYPFSLSEADADANCCGVPYPDGSAGGCCGWACQFTPQFDLYNLQDPVPENGGAYDLDSIMLYRNDAFARPGTLTLLDGPNTYQNPQTLSSGDINRVKELYGCANDTKPPVTCPKGCNPLAGQNTCSFPTAATCVYPSPALANPRAACACRAGFKATAPGITDADTTKQWRLPAPEGNFRVWVAEGVVCDTLCDVPTGAESCREVAELPADCLHN